MQAAAHHSVCFTYSEDAAAVVGLLQMQRRAGDLSGASFGPVRVAHGEDGEGHDEDADGEEAEAEDTEEAEDVGVALSTGQALPRTL